MTVSTLKSQLPRWFFYVYFQYCPVDLSHQFLQPNAASIFSHAFANGIIMLFFAATLKREKVMRIALLVIFLFISGYSFAEVQDKTSQCLEGLKNDGRFSSIANHLALDGQGAASPQMLTDNTRPSEQQKRAIADWIDARSECVGLSPTQVSVNLHMTFLDIVPDLYNDQATFGEFNKKWQALFKENTEMPGKALDKPITHHH